MNELRVIHGTPEPEPYIDRVEMARQLGIHVRTLDRMVANDEIPSCTWGRRTRRFKASVVIAHLARREMSEQKETAA